MRFRLEPTCAPSGTATQGTPLPPAHILSNLVAERPTLRLLVRIVRENGRAYLPRYLVSFLFMFVFAGATALSAWLMRDVIDKLFVDRDPAALAWIPAAILAIFTVKGVASYLQEVSLSRIGNRFVAETQQRMFDHLLQMDLSFYNARPSNELMTVITLGANAARDMLNIVAVGFGRDAMTLAGLVVVMVTQDPAMSAICLLGGPFLALGMRKLNQRVRKASEQQYHSVSTIMGAMRETCQGI